MAGAALSTDEPGHQAWATTPVGARSPEDGLGACSGPALRWGVSIRNQATYSAGQRGAGIKGAGTVTPTPSGSGEADVGRASQLQHAIEDVDGDVHLGGPTLLRMRAQPVADHLLPSADDSLGSGALRVPGGLLPRPAAPLGDELEVAVPLGRLALSRLARHGCRARRHNDRRFGMALADAGVDAVLVVGAVARDLGDRPRHLVEQGANLRAVGNLAAGQHCGDDLAGVGVHTEVQLPPGPARLGAVFLDQPLAGPAQLQARAVHQGVGA